jgi:membrane protease subunit (stomatin/prohibitin family)
MEDRKEDFMDDIFKKMNSVSRAVNSVSNVADSGRRLKNNVGGMTGSSSKKQTKKQQAADDPNSWKCSCKSVNTTNFCAKCGKARPACPECGTFVANDSKFCPDCGTKI